MHLSDLRDPNPLTSAFIDACVNDGMRRLRHHNEGDNEGVAQTIVTQRKGLRWSSSDGYLRPARKRPNLEIVTGALVNRVEFEGRRAVGVSYSRTDGSTASAHAGREVIICGGAVNSTQVLLRSGIGDPTQLGALDIEVTAASPRVGAGLRDHLMVALVIGSREPITLVDAEKPRELLKFLTQRRGMLTSNVGEAAAFVRTRDDLDAPDIELIFGPVPYIDHGQIEEPPGHGFALGPILLQPRSVGSVRLASPDPSAAPLIDPAYFTEAEDRDTMRAGLRRALALLDVEPLASMAGDPIEAPTSDDDRDIDEFLDAQCETLYHPIGTCAMGPDPDTVVDLELSVRGVDGLRVADASVMPMLNRGHTHAPAVMIGERAAAMIRTARG
jgi:choline dehydrogenase